MRLRLLFLLLSFLAYFISNAQTLKGRVMTERGSWAPNVSVQFKNHRNSIITNPDGSFKITATSLPDTLVFSSVGFEPYEVIITEKNISDPDFQVVLLERRAELAEVVVTGFGAGTRKREMAGSVKIRGMSTPASSGAPTYPVHEKINFISPGYVGADTVRISARSRILTAGEVNDFMKWKRWEDYAGNEFKMHAEHWGLNPEIRYTVQVSDRNGRAVVNEPVFLVNKDSGDTTWRAYTDNTGKAELWAGFLKGSPKEGFMIVDGRGNKVNRASVFENGMNFLKSNRVCEGSKMVDIAFVVDATGSMGDEIEFLKLELEDVIRAATKEYEDLELNTAAVFYRDEGDEYVTRYNNFHSDMLKVLNFIKLQGANGGGDTPEAVDEALKAALDSLNWNMSSRTRLLFLVLDAPPHGSAKEKIAKLIVRAAEKGVRIIPIACSGIDKSTEFLLRTMALATNGTYTFLTNHSGVGNPHIEPTTDSYNVELLGELMQRLIRQFVISQDCSSTETQYVNSTTPVNILSVMIFPNPTSGRFQVEENEDIKEMYITDFTGKILMKLSAVNKRRNVNVDLSGYPSGTYLVKYVTKEGKLGAEKVVLVN